MNKVFKSAYQKALSRNTIPERIINAEYAVRGQIPMRGEEISRDIKTGQVKYDFDAITTLHSGNPLALGQNPITFNREVISVMMNPTGLANSPYISHDSRNRAGLYMRELDGPIGSYSGDSRGFRYCRQVISQYINQRDNVGNSSRENIYLTNGMGEGVKLIYNMLIRSKKDAILLPIPHYPLYSVLSTLYNGTAVPYQLDEQSNWSINPEQIKKNISDAKSKGLDIRSIVIINPNNPTGSLMSNQNLEEILDICYTQNIMVIADEVYQNNIYKDDLRFKSIRSILNTMPSNIRDNLELVSLNSTSKGLFGECGLRGGYMEIHNFDKFAADELYKLRSIEICANSVGQVMTLLLVDPPKINQESFTIVNQYVQELSLIREGLKERSEIMCKRLNQMHNVTCTEVLASMSGFPSVKISQKAQKEAAKLGMQADFFYCMSLLNEQGIITVPGSAFGLGLQNDHIHFRLNNLLQPAPRLDNVLDKIEKFNKNFHEKYQDGQLFGNMSSDLHQSTQQQILS